MPRLSVVPISAFLLSVLALTLSACGGGGDSNNAADGARESQRAAAISLQQAMDASSRSIDAVRGTRDSLERLGASLQPQIAQTGDVIGLLTPKSAAEEADKLLLAAAREQRSFLQFVAGSTESRSISAAANSVTRAREAGKRATAAYSAVAQSAEGLAGLLPASTTFNTGRLRDAVRAANRVKGSPKRSADRSGSKPDTSRSTASTSCGDGLAVNSVTTCPFARNVRDAYQGTNGSNVIDVYSPVTKRYYTMTCADGLPVVCRGGNGAVVTIR